MLFFNEAGEIAMSRSRHIGDQIDVIFIRADRLDCGADGDRALEPDGDGSQQRVIGPRQPVADGLVTPARQLILGRGDLEALADTLDQSGELRLAQQIVGIQVIHCSAYVFC